MRSNLKKCIKKLTAAVVSAALVFSATPVSMSKVAKAEEVGTENAVASGTVRNVCFGVANGMNVPDATKVVFSVSKFDKRQNISDDAAKVSAVQDSQNSWVSTVKETDDSLGAYISDTSVEKITAVRGYEDYSNYDGKVIRIEHKSAASILSDATQTSAVIADSENNVIYYGKLSDANALISDFKLPKGLTQGKYELYVFAEKVESYTDAGFRATATDKISDIGEPIEIEVLDSLKLYVEVDWPEFDSEPDTTADIYISRDNDYSETVSGSAITWNEKDSSDEVDKFEFNKQYTAETNLQIKEELYMSDNVEVFFGNKEAEVSYLGSGNLVLSYTFDNITIERIIIGGEFIDGSAILNAYFDTSRPVKVDDNKYPCQWYLGAGPDDGSMTIDNDCTSSEYIVFDYNSYIKVSVSVNDFVQNANVTSTPVKVKDGELKVDFIVGVNKSDETYRGKKDGIIYGMKSGMSCTNIDSGKSYYPDENGVVSGLPAGKYKVGIDTSSSQTPSTTPDTTAPAAGDETKLNEVYAEYEIIGGRGINVGFNSDGGSNVQSLIGISYGEKVSEPAEPKREGYTFKGWYKDCEFTETWDFENDTVEHDITLYAKWEKNVDNDGNTGSGDDTDNDGNGGNTGSGDDTNNDGNGGNTGSGDDTGNGGNTGGSGNTGSSGSGGMANYPTGGGSQTNTTPPSSTPAATPNVTPAATPSSAPAEVPNSTPVVTTPIPSASNAPAESPNASPTGDSNNASAKKGEKLKVGDTTFTCNGNNTVEMSGSKKTKGKVIVPETVTINGVEYKITKIGAGAYSGTNIKEIIIGNNVETIGTGAFKGCVKLKNVSLPSSLEKLGNSSFEGCTNLKKAVLPNNVKKVGDKAFKDCTNLKKLKVGKKAGKGSSKKTGLKRGNDILLTGTEFDDEGILLLGAAKSTKVSIGASALENCVNLRSVIINSQVTKIGNSTFKNCVKLASILVKSLKLKKVGNKSLKGVSNCKISVPSSKFKPYSTLFKNKGQGKKVVIAKS